MRRLVLAALALAACSDPAPEKLPFPPGFLFGAAVAGFQNDMGCPTLPASECEDPNSDWYAFVTDPEMIAESGNSLSGQHPDVGPGMWELYESDLDLLAGQLGGNAFRFSLEWSRIFPTATDGIDGHEALLAVADADAVAHYHALLAAMKARGLHPLVTLNHYTLPLWIHDGVACHKDVTTCTERGWLDGERTVREIAKYAGFCAEEFGGEIDQWATENEPLAIVLPGYLFPTADRTNPPAISLAFDEAKAVFTALVEGHARMYDAVKAGDTEDADGDGVAADVGLVFAMAPAAPMDPDDPKDVQGAANVFYLWNTAFLDAVIRGDLDEDLDGTPTHREDLADRMDYLGINYYTRVTVAGTNNATLPKFSPLTTFNPLTMQPWEDYPRGIYEMTKLVQERYGVPMVISENGAADPDDDGTMGSYITRHLTWLSRAVSEGADVRGYFYWTLVDDYEWNHGMNVRMGLWAVDPTDAAKTRVPRQAVDVYARIIEAGEIPADLADLYPAPAE